MSNETLVASLSADGYVEVAQGELRKKISIKDYASVINRLIDEEDQVSSESPIKYPSSIHSSIRTNQGYTLHLYYPETEKELQHTRVGTRKMYIPNVLISVDLQEIQGKPEEYSIGQVYWYCTDKSRTALPAEWPRGFSSQDHIWTLPFPNMFNSGSMCTGGNRLPSVIYRDWTVLDMLYNDVFIRSPFNNDLSINNVPDHNQPQEWFNFMHEYYNDEETDRFPYHMLSNF